jgi:MFS transporter, PPP family, 3-phenylpropionic acid transporter
MQCDSASEPAAMSFGFSSRLAGVYATTSTMIGFQLPFFPLWLNAKGLDAGMIGVVLAVPQVVRVLAIPVAARAADRGGVLREAIVVTGWASVAGYLLVGLASGAPAILLTFTLASLAYSPVMPLVEAYALKGLAARGGAYGPVRLWGSVAFIAGTFVAGFAADTIAARHLIWLILAGAAAMALSTLTLEPVDGRTAAPSQKPSARKALLRDPAFIAVLAAAGLIQASHAVYYGFSALAWRGDGYDGMAIAALWALGVIAEIVLFAMSGRLPSFVSPSVLLMIGAAGGALRWTAMAFDPPGVVLPALQVLHAASFGATHLGAITFLARHAPAGQSATAQGYLAIVLGAAMAASTGLSGVLFEAFAARSYAAMALAAIAGGVCAFIAHRLGRVAAV